MTGSRMQERGMRPRLAAKTLTRGPGCSPSVIPGLTLASELLAQNSYFDEAACCVSLHVLSVVFYCGLRYMFHARGQALV